ncbi:hypothetical protein [Paraglaciecola sp. 2405UD69-4]|uniref:hypothetical protein n=1 Tax=Paraglaciecola sp. 2405UD69-4 TaxID=3391836 RepID=UPI0039C8EC9C
MDLRKIMTVTFIVIVLAGCTLAATPLNNEQITKIEKIGIVSFVGNEFSYANLGFTVFGNSENLVEQEYIDFDKEVTRVLKNTINTKLNNPKKIDVVDVEFDRAALLASYRQKGEYKKFKVDLAANELAQIAKENNVNYLLVVTRGYNAIDNGAGYMGGIGISRTSAMKEGQLTIHNYLDYKLFDASTLSAPSFFSTAAMNFGQKRDVQFLWKEPLTDYSETERAELLSMILEDIEYRVPWAVTYMLTYRKD